MFEHAWSQRDDAGISVEIFQSSVNKSHVVDGAETLLHHFIFISGLVCFPCMLKIPGTYLCCLCFVSPWSSAQRIRSIQRCSGKTINVASYRHRQTYTHTHVLPLHSITVFTQWANTDTLTCTPLQCSQLRVNRYLTQPVACDRVQPTVPHTQCSVISLAMASLSKSEEHVGESQRQPPFTPLAHVAFCNETPQPWQLASMMSLPALRYRPLTGIGSALWNHLGFVPFHKLWQRVSFSRRP